MAISQLWIQSQGYSAREDRVALAALLSGGGGPFNSRIGVRSTVDLQFAMADAQHGNLGSGVVFIAWAQSVYLLGNDSPYQLTFAAADFRLTRESYSVIAPGSPTTRRRAARRMSPSWPCCPARRQ